MNSRSRIRFCLNDHLVELDDVPPHRNRLDWLRLEQPMRRTKEGCAEGDCGACAAPVGRPGGRGKLVYEAAAAALYAQDFSPPSDWRASAAYRLLVARNLLLRFSGVATGSSLTRVRDLAHG